MEVLNGEKERILTAYLFDVYRVCQRIADSLRRKHPRAEEFLQDPAYAFARYLDNLPENAALFLDDFDVLRGAGVIEDFSMILRDVCVKRTGGQGAAVPILIGSVLPPELFITNKFVAPFNVGLHVRLRNFERGEAETLIRVALPTISASDADTLYELVGGHPYLSDPAFIGFAGQYSWGTGECWDLVRTAMTVDGPFGTHLSILGNSLSDKDRKDLAGHGLHEFAPSDLRRFEEIGLLRQNRTSTTSGLAD